MRGDGAKPEIQFVFDNFSDVMAKWSARAMIGEDCWGTGWGETQFDALHDLAILLVYSYESYTSRPPKER